MLFFLSHDHFKLERKWNFLQTKKMLPKTYPSWMKILWYTRKLVHTQPSTCLLIFSSLKFITMVTLWKYLERTWHHNDALILSVSSRLLENACSHSLNIKFSTWACGETQKNVVQIPFDSYNTHTHTHILRKESYWSERKERKLSLLRTCQLKRKIDVRLQFLFVLVSPKLTVFPFMLLMHNTSLYPHVCECVCVLGKTHERKRNRKLR
jgi:hypothetical protein